MPRLRLLRSTLIAVLAVIGIWAAGATSASAAAELTPAQQCVKDGHAIPTVTLPPTARAAAVRTGAVQTLAGWAFLDANTPLVGARVRIIGANGRPVKLLRGSTATTNADGTFLLAVTRLPRGFRFEVKGGRQHGQRFNGTLVAAGTTATAYVSPVSTILSAYRGANPRKTLAEATAAVSRTLGFPNGTNFTTDVRFTNKLFDAQTFLKRGPFARTVQAVVRASIARRRLAFPGGPALRGIGTDLLVWGGKQLASGAVSYVGGLAMGWVLGQLGIQSGAAVQLEDLKDALDKISTQLTELGQQLSDLQTEANKHLLATLVASLRDADSAVTGKLADLQAVAGLVASKQDKAYVEAQACEKLAGLYPLASGTLSYGYVPDLLNKAFFPAPGITPLTEAFIRVVKDESRWWTTGSSDEVAQMVGYWQGIEQGWLQIELEWQHSVHPCPTTPAPTASNCLALSWAGRYMADIRAQTDTLPRAMPGGFSIDTKTGLAWAPGYPAADSTLPHPPPATYAQTFGPKGDWIDCPGPDQRGRCLSRSEQGLHGACTDVNPKTMIPNARDVDVCEINRLGNPGPFSSESSSNPYDASWYWYPPNGEQIGNIISGYSTQKFKSPLDYLTAPWSEGGAALSRAWLDRSNGLVWFWSCSRTSGRGCDVYNLKDGNTFTTNDGKAGFLLTSRTPVFDTRYFIVGGSTDFGSGGSYVKYAATTGSDTKAGKPNDCKNYLLPCKTIAHAQAVGGFSEVIELGPGTFTGPVTLDKNPTIVGAGAGLTTIDGGGGSKPAVTVSENARIEGVTITRGTTGIQVNARKALTLVDSTVAGNNGPGILNQGTTTVLGSTIGPNSAYGLRNQSTATLVNSTIAGNGLSGLTNLGDATAQAEPSLTLINDTSTRNGVNGVSSSIGVTRLTNTILAGNAVAYRVSDCSGTVIAGSAGHDLIANLGSCTFDGGSSAGNIVGTDAKLGTLGPNGGQTKTVPLLPGSPAIGAGDPATCAAAPVSGLDQRGYVRPSGSCDIGAFDSKAQNIPPPPS